MARTTRAHQIEQQREHLLCTFAATLRDQDRRVPTPHLQVTSGHLHVPFPQPWCATRIAGSPHRTSSSHLDTSLISFPQICATRIAGSPYRTSTAGWQGNHSLRPPRNSARPGLQDAELLHGNVAGTSSDSPRGTARPRSFAAKIARPDVQVAHAARPGRTARLRGGSLRKGRSTSIAGPPRPEPARR